MKKILVLIIFPLIISSINCATRGYQKANVTEAHINKALNCMEKMKISAEKSTTALNNLISQQSGDLRPQFRTFSKNYQQLKSYSKSCKKYTDKIRNLGRDYFVNWTNKISNIDNPQIQSLSRESFTETRDVHQSLNDILWKAEHLYGPFVNDLEDIHKYLSINLTPDSVELIMHIAEDVLLRKNEVINVINSAIEELQKTAQVYSTKAESNQPSGQ